jgi:FkbM family methyltransferase
MDIASNTLSRVPPRYTVPFIAWQYRFFEPELKRIREFVPADRGAVDVGVWWGPWTWWLARRVPRVDSFEPNAALVARLEGVMPSNVTIHPVALSDRSGEADLWLPSGRTGTEGRGSIEAQRTTESGWLQQKVQTRRLDEFDLGDVGFLKIDVEGHELAVLQGATHLLETQRPTVMIEIESGPESDERFDAIISLLGEHSYSGSYLLNGQWHAIEDLDRDNARHMAAELSRHGYAANLLLYVRRYAHNFLFRPT